MLEMCHKFPYRFMPESLRWLVSKGKHKEAFELVTKIAKVNGVEVPDCSFMVRVRDHRMSKIVLFLCCSVSLER